MNGGKGSDFLFENGKIVRLQNDDAEKTSVGISSDTQSRRALESYRETRARKTAIKRTLAVCIIFAVVLVLVTVAVFVFFRINNVSISGSEKYTDAELYSALGLSKSSNLFFTSTAALESRLRKAYPSLEEISIKKQLPDKLTITVTDGVGKYYLKAGGDYYTLTEKLKVIDYSSKAPPGCVELLTCDLSSAVMGKTLEFKKDTHYNYLCTLLSEINGHKTASHINRVDMSEKFNVKLRYDDRFIIILGDADKATVKLNLADKLISTLSADESGIIDAADIEKCSFRKTNDLN
jgi:cell division protein FtsQ